MEIDTELLPYQLLQELQRIEVALGRVRTVKNGPRIIDLDILTYGDVILTEEALCIPHPLIFERDFVLTPLKEIAPLVVEKLLKKRFKLRRKRALANPAWQGVRKSQRKVIKKKTVKKVKKVQKSKKKKR